MTQTQPTPPDANQDRANQNYRTTPPRNASAARTGADENSGTDPIALLTADHRHVEQLFSAFEKATGNDQKAELAKQICTELVVHTLIEEEIFYPACQGHVERRMLDEAQVEHDGAKALINEIQISSPDDQYYEAKVKVLSEDIKHHIREEEKPGEGILAKAKATGIATAELANQLAARKQELTEEAKAGALGPPEARSFRARTEAGANQATKEVSMARGSSSTMDRERDERGRFVSDDDNDRDYRRRSSGGSRQDDDDDDRRSSRSRDEDGRFTSSRSRDDDDDDRRGSSRDHGQGGWFGDPEGHSRASREGREERGGSRSRSRDDDDDRRSSRSRDDEGRFTSSRSRSRDDDD
ncbi:MAG: hemerythrin domain-containing protein, partial [Stellaceae bacterium]